MKTFIEEARLLAVAAPKSVVFSEDGKIKRIPQSKPFRQCQSNGEKFNPFGRKWWKH